jgi:hypothetical protein
MPYTRRCVASPLPCDNPWRILYRKTRLGNIVTLINDRSTVILDLVSVRRPRAKTHEDDASGVAKPEIHSALEIYSDRRTHLHIGKHIIGLNTRDKAPTLKL